MYISQIHIINFKTFDNVKVHFNQSINVITGVNNSGKTTLLEALALWQECFSKLLRQARKKNANPLYESGDYTLGTTLDKYFPFDEINSVRSPNFVDVFYQGNKAHKINIVVIIKESNGEEIEIGFEIGASGLNYIIQLINYKNYDFKEFNKFFNFQKFPEPICVFYASPVSSLLAKENFFTSPQIKQKIKNRESATVLRNRLYSLYRHSDPSRFKSFLEDLRYVLGNEQIDIKTTSDMQIESDVIFLVTMTAKDSKKDIGLLGSGTLQIIEILINLYANRADLSLILLDEPDSHIHRSIQKRLFEVLTRFAIDCQIFLTTHNESLVKETPMESLIHLDGSSKEYRAIQPMLQNGRFRGILPTHTTSVITALADNTTGLDFINAMEADLIIFVEGAEDAYAIDILLKSQQKNRSQLKVSYWILGGVSNFYDYIVNYKLVFSSIKNGKTLWEKSIAVIDRDILNDAHLEMLSCIDNKESFFEKNIQIRTFILKAYTLEAVIFTDVLKANSLILAWLQKYRNIKIIDELNLEEFYEAIGSKLEERYSTRKNRKYGSPVYKLSSEAQ